MIHRFVKRDSEKKISEASLVSLMRSPMLTEKSVQANAVGQYFFKVSLWANKFQIQKAVEKIFDVKVASINTLVVKGKTKRFRGRLGRTSDFKKAMVTLEEGFNIDLEKIKI